MGGPVGRPAADIFQNPARPLGPRLDQPLVGVGHGVHAPEQVRILDGAGGVGLLDGRGMRPHSVGFCGHHSLLPAVHFS